MNEKVTSNDCSHRLFTDLQPTARIKTVECRLFVGYNRNKQRISWRKKYRINENGKQKDY